MECCDTIESREREQVRYRFIQVIDMIYIEKLFFEDIDKDSLGYEYDIPTIRKLVDEEAELHFNSNVTFFVGENGMGKSTLLEAIAIAYGFNPEGGTKNFNFSTSNTHSKLYEDLVLSKSYNTARDGFFYRAESFYNVSTNIDELNYDLKLLDSYGGKSLHKQSHGEAFLSLVQNRFSGKGLYLLDEPEAALSPSRLMTLIHRMSELENDDSQFIIATHSPILMSYPGSEIVLFNEDGFEKVELEETDHYIITKAFMNNRSGMLKHLLD